MRKKITAMVLACMMAMACIAGCGGEEAAAPQEENNTAQETASESPTLDKIQSEGKIVLATDAVWAPFEYIGSNGEIVGSDIDMAKIIAEDLGVELEIINSSFDTLSGYITSGEAQLLISAMTITDERKATLGFSVPYTIASQYIIVREDNNDVVTIDDMAGYRIGTQLGTTGDFIVCDEIDLDGGVLNGSGASYAQYKSVPDASLDLKNGQLDAIVCDVLLAKNLCNVNEGLKCFELAFEDKRDMTEELGIAMPKDDQVFIDKVNEIIQPLVDDGTIQQQIDTHTELAAQI